ncbi:MAG: bifunctional folylpolyglutamate synthase/dihydrofolate synthase [Phycisphaerae bacterium]|nr:bifunctional folylpolyglutamate synthase/dihydrofolate synthase [Phycisphaerae bacterium]
MERTAIAARRTTTERGRLAKPSPRKPGSAGGVKGGGHLPKGGTGARRRSSSGGKKRGFKAIRTYASALAFLDAQVNYERLPPRAQARGFRTLARVKRVLADLGDPQTSFRSVHIAGSKGKGSTATMLSEMLLGNGLTVGVFTSPHLMDVRERVAINRKLISEEDMTRLIGRVAKIVRGYEEKDHPTYFEILTAVAFQHFKEKEVDIAIVETGLGGRYDATNVLVPEACGITSISYDHMPQLGNTLAKIAEEKAGIFKEDVPVVSAQQPPEVKKTLKKVADRTGTPLFFAGDDFAFSYRFESSRASGPHARIGVSTPTSHFDHLVVPLVGEHQAINCGVALGLLDQLKILGLNLDDEASISGLARVKLEGRMEMLCEQPRVIADGAHNAASIEALMRAIGQNIPYDSMVVIFGCCADKDIDGMLRLIQLGADKLILTGIKSPRGADPADLARAFSEVSGRMVQVATNLPEALEIAQKAITREDLICITGSFYLVSEAKRLFTGHPHRPEAAVVPSE